MDKTKTSVRRRPSAKIISNKTKNPRIEKAEDYDPMISLLDQNKIAAAIWECLKNGDADGIIEVISIHLEACKADKSKHPQLLGDEFYLAHKQENPTLKEFAKMVKKAYKAAHK